MGYRIHQRVEHINTIHTGAHRIPKPLFIHVICIYMEPTFEAFSIHTWQTKALERYCAVPSTALLIVIQ